MKKLNLDALSRDEMRNIMAGSECGSVLDCRYQSPSFTCAGGVAPTCAQRICTSPIAGESVSTHWTFGCGQG